MKVLLLTTDSFGGHGGIAYYNRCLADALVNLPEISEVVVVPRVVRFPKPSIPAKVRFVESAVGGKGNYLRAIASLISESFGLVICGHVNLLPVAVPFAAIKRSPLVLQVHGIEAWERRRGLTEFWLAHISAIWSVSGVTRDRFNAWAKLPDSIYTIIPNAIHVSQYGIKPRRPDLIDRYALRDKTVIMTLARLAGYERYKGIDEVIEVMPDLLLRVPSLIYIVIGDGDDQQRLSDKAQRVGVGDRVIFTGYVKDEEKADYLRLADAFVLPGRGEGFGIVYLEAMACGVNVVGSMLDGSREALRDGVLGELANPADPESVRQCILRALCKPPGVPPGLAWFDWPQFEQRLASAVRQLVGGAGLR